jgi:hypothetical protein
MNPPTKLHDVINIFTGDICGPKRKGAKCFREEKLPLADSIDVQDNKSFEFISLKQNGKYVYRLK